MTDSRWVLRVKFAESQPRVPAGNPEGGQWTRGGSVGGGEGQGEGTLSLTRDDFVAPDGEMRPPGEIAEKLGVYRHGSYRPNEKVRFSVEGQGRDFYAWMTHGSGKNSNRAYVHIVKVVPQNIFDPVTGKREPAGTMGKIHVMAQHPNGKWKEVLD